MKDSGVEWIGRIPEEWGIKKLSSLFDEVTKKVSDKDYPPLSVTKQGILPQIDGVAKTDNGDNRKLVRIGDFVINSRSDRKGSSGVSEYEGSVSLINIVFQPKEAVDMRYMHHLLRCCGFQEEFYRWGHGIVADLWTTNSSDAKNIILPTPSYEEQASISRDLDTKCAEIDKVVEQTRATIEEYKKLKQAIITEAVTKGVRGPRPMKPSGVEWIGDIPGEWEVKRIKYVVSLRNDKGVYNPSQDKYIGLENIVGFSDVLVETGTTYAESEYQVCRAGDVMYSRLRPYLGKSLVCPIDGFCTGELMLFSSFHGERRYLRYWFLNELVTAVIVQSTYGTKMPRANPNYILNLPIILPDATEQQEIVAYLDTKCAEIDRIIGKKEQLIEELGSYKKSLIYEYVTGKKQVLYK